MIGASPQAVYNWEQAETRPRQEFLDKIALIRGLTKPQVQDLLDQHSNPKTKGKTVKKTSKKAEKKTAGKPKTEAARGI